MHCNVVPAPVQVWPGAQPAIVMEYVFELAVLPGVETQVTDVTSPDAIDGLHMLPTAVKAWFILLELGLAWAKEKFIVAAEVSAAATLCVAALPALELKSTNLGSAVAANIPNITITTISSIKVKPLAFFMQVTSQNLRKQC